MIKGQFLKIIILGFSSLIVNYSIFFIFYKFLYFHYTLAYGTGFIMGVLSAYKFNKRWTFGIKKNTKKYFLKYFLIYVFSLFLGLGFLKFLVDYLEIIAEIGNIITICLTTVTNFLGVKFWVFKK